MKSGNKHTASLLVGAGSLFLICASGVAAQTANPRIGEAGFKEHCAACHADGGNIIKPAKTLSKKDRDKNGVVTEKDIIDAMRKPGLWCLATFNKEAIPEDDAQEIAKYIIKTFR